MLCVAKCKGKNISGKEDMECYGGEGCSYRQSALRGCTEKVTFESRPEESDHVAIWGRVGQTEIN